MKKYLLGIVALLLTHTSSYTGQAYTFTDFEKKLQVVRRDKNPNALENVNVPNVDFSKGISLEKARTIFSPFSHVKKINLSNTNLSELDGKILIALFKSIPLTNTGVTIDITLNNLHRLPEHVLIKLFTLLLDNKSAIVKISYSEYVQFPNKVKEICDSFIGKNIVFVDEKEEKVAKVEKSLKKKSRTSQPDKWFA